ncbi:MAG: peptidylprolyl isomerase [Candidatus Cloacimonas sp.]
MKYKIPSIIIICLLWTLALMAAKPDPKAVVGKIGDREYSYKNFNDGFKAYLQYYGKGRTLTKQDSIKLNNQYWEELVGIYVYDQAIKAGKIKVTDAELEAEIKKNIPAEIKQLKDFQSNGKFDKTKYEQALKDHPDFKNQVISYVRELYSYNKLIKTIKSEVKANPDSVQKTWLYNNDYADAQIIYFNYNELTQINATEDEAREFYDAHKEEFKRQNGRSYLIARFAGNLSKMENSATKAQENKAQSTALFNRAKEIGLQKAATEMNISIEETPYFNAQDQIIPLVGRAPNLISFAFQNPIGSIPDIYYAPTGDILVLELRSEIPEYYIDFELKKQEMTIKATRAKRMLAMENYVQDFKQKETPETYLQAAARDSIAIIEAEKVLANGEIKPLGKIPALNEAILNTPVGSFTPFIENDKHWYLALVTKREHPDLSVWEKDKAKIIAAAEEELQEDHLNKWYIEQRNKIQIIDNRKDFYELLIPIKL